MADRKSAGNNSASTILTPLYTIGAESGFLFAGFGGSEGGFTSGAATTTARFHHPSGICVSGDGRTIYIADTSNNAVRAIRDGVVNTVAGRGGAGYVNHPTGFTNLVQFDTPTAVSIDHGASGDVLYVCDESNHCIRRIDSSGVVTYAGAPEPTTAASGGGGSGSGFANGEAVSKARFNGPASIVVDIDHNVLVVDSGNFRIAKVSWKDKTVSTLAGTGSAGYRNGSALQSRFMDPVSVCIALCSGGEASDVDRQWRVCYVADNGGSGVRPSVRRIRIGPPPYEIGEVSTIPCSIPLPRITGVAVDADRNVYLADGTRVIKISTATSAELVLASIEPVDPDGVYLTARGIALSPDGGYVYVCDEYNCRVLRIPTTQHKLDAEGKSPSKSRRNSIAMTPSHAAAVLRTPAPPPPQPASNQSQSKPKRPFGSSAKSKQPKWVWSESLAPTHAAEMALQLKRSRLVTNAASAFASSVAPAIASALATVTDPKPAPSPVPVTSPLTAGGSGGLMSPSAASDLMNTNPFASPPSKRNAIFAGSQPAPAQPPPPSLTAATIVTHTTATASAGVDCFRRMTRQNAYPLNLFVDPATERERLKAEREAAERAKLEESQRWFQRGEKVTESQLKLTARRTAAVVAAAAAAVVNQRVAAAAASNGATASTSALVRPASASKSVSRFHFQTATKPLSALRAELEFDSESAEEPQTQRRVIASTPHPTGQRRGSITESDDSALATPLVAATPTAAAVTASSPPAIGKLTLSELLRSATELLSPRRPDPTSASGQSDGKFDDDAAGDGEGVSGGEEKTAAFTPQSSPPESPRRARVRKADIYAKLTDHHLYTGMHKARFDAESGAGRGLSGRDMANESKIIDLKQMTRTNLRSAIDTRDRTKTRDRVKHLWGFTNLWGLTSKTRSEGQNTVMPALHAIGASSPFIYAGKGVEVPLTVHCTPESLIRTANKHARTFHTPVGVGVDARGHVIVIDSMTHCIRRVAPPRSFSREPPHTTVIAGSVKGISGFANRPDMHALLNTPTHCAVDAHNGTIYFVDAHHCIRKVRSNGYVNTVAGRVMPGHADGEGATRARFNQIGGLTVHPLTEEVWVCDSGNHVIRRVSPDQQVSTVFGRPPKHADNPESGHHTLHPHGVGGSGPVIGAADSDSDGRQATFCSPTAIVIDLTNSDSDTTILYVVDQVQRAIRRLAVHGGSHFPVAGAVTTIQCAPPQPFDCINGMAIDPKHGDTLYVSDRNCVYQLRLPPVPAVRLETTTDTGLRFANVTTVGASGTAVAASAVVTTAAAPAIATVVVYVSSTPTDPHRILPSTSALAMSGDGTLFIVDPFNRRLLRISERLKQTNDHFSVFQREKARKGTAFYAPHALLSRTPRTFGPNKGKVPHRTKQEKEMAELVELARAEQAKEAIAHAEANADADADGDGSGDEDGAEDQKYDSAPVRMPAPTPRHQPLSVSPTAAAAAAPAAPPSDHAALRARSRHARLVARNSAPPQS